MKIRYNRFAVFPVMCHNLLDRWLKKTICNECLKKYDVGGKK